MDKIGEIIKAVSGIINPKAVISDRPLRLEELSNIGKKGKCQFVEFKNLKGKYFVFKLDDENLGRVSNYFDPSAPDINKACDAVLFTEINGINYIFFIELKSLKISEAKKQLINGEIFVSYLSNLLKAYKNTSLDDFEKRFFIFTTDLKKKNSTDNKNKIKPLARDGKKLFISACNKRHYIDRFDLS